MLAQNGSRGITFGVNQFETEVGQTARTVKGTSIGDVENDPV